MRIGYHLYPEGRQKLIDSGIADKVKALAEELPDYTGHIMRNEVMEIDCDQRKKGLYDNQPEGFASEFKTHMFRLFVRPENYHWRVSRKVETKEECDIPDILLFTGEPASFVLKPEELWDHKKFGFNSPFDLVSCIGALMMERKEYRKAYEWEREHDGVKELTRITGDGNCDLRVHQRDMTPYPTLDPLRNPILMRPITNNDRKWIAGHDSTEPELLVTVLKYIEQKGLAIDYQIDPIGFMEWAHSLGQRGGMVAEHFSVNVRSPRVFFGSFDQPIPKFPAKHTHYSIGTAGDGSYGAYIDGDDLVFSYHNFREDPKDIEMKFYPSDVDHLVKGIIYQCANGLGRTSAGQVIEILKYRYSDDFLKD